MLNRSGLVVQMAKAFVGEGPIDQTEPDEKIRKRADDALTRVEMYLGIEIDEAKRIITRVLEDVS
jgi:hypothetical protein